MLMKLVLIIGRCCTTCSSFTWLVTMVICCVLGSLSFVDVASTGWSGLFWIVAWAWSFLRTTSFITWWVSKSIWHASCIMVVTSKSINWISLAWLLIWGWDLVIWLHWTLHSSLLFRTWHQTLFALDIRSRLPFRTATSVASRMVVRVTSATGIVIPGCSVLSGTGTSVSTWATWLRCTSSGRHAWTASVTVLNLLLFSVGVWSSHNMRSCILNLLYILLKCSRNFGATGIGCIWAAFSIIC